MSGQVISGQVMSGQVSSGKVMYGQDINWHLIKGKEIKSRGIKARVSSSQVTSPLVRSGQVRSCQVRSGLVRSGQVSWAEVEEGNAENKIQNRAGPDRSTPKIAKLALNTRFETTLKIMKDTLRLGKTPVEWKTTRLVLILNPGSRKFWPSCFEQLILKLLKEEPQDETRELADNQYGFREGCTGETDHRRS